MSKHKFTSAGLLLSNEEVDVVELIRSTQSNEMIAMPFKKKIAWIQETQSKLALFYKQTLLKEYTSYHDHYGYETSKKAAIKNAEEYIKSMELEKDSGLVFKVLTTTTKMPCVLIEEPTEQKKLVGEAIYDLEHIYLKDDNLLTEMLTLMKAGMFNPHYERIEEIKKLIRVDNKTVSEDVVVWDSLKGHCV